MSSYHKLNLVIAGGFFGVAVRQASDARSPFVCIMLCLAGAVYLALSWDELS